MKHLTKHTWTLWIALAACGPDPLPPMFNECETSDDCSKATPICRVLDPAGTGNPISVCTASCSDDFLNPVRCPKNPAVNNEMFVCLGVDENGKVDASSDEAFCMVPCGRGEVAGGGCHIEGERSEYLGPGVCALLPYDDFLGPVYVCLEPGTPLPPPVIPVYNDCGYPSHPDPSDCSELTPICRRIDPWNKGYSGSFCTRPCFEDADCPATGPDDAPVSGRCLGVNAQGNIDLESTEKICFQGCLEAEETCVVAPVHPTRPPHIGTCGPVLPEDTDYSLGLVCY